VACLGANSSDVEQQRSSRQARKLDSKRIRTLERELNRKDKALAETAALLVLSKKAEAIWGRKDEDE